jgi:hypothetical protein
MPAEVWAGDRAGAALMVQPLGARALTGTDGTVEELQGVCMEETERPYASQMADPEYLPHRGLRCPLRESNEVR